jgi:hypothetical protein
MGVPHASILRVGFVSYCHDRSGQQTKTGNNETKSPTRKPDVRGTPIHLPTWCPVRPPAWARLWVGSIFGCRSPSFFVKGADFLLLFFRTNDYSIKCSDVVGSG